MYTDVMPAPEEESQKPELKDILHSSLARIAATSKTVRGETSALLGNNERLAFDHSLLQSMSDQIELWEKQKPFDLRISQLRGLHMLVAFLERGGNEHNTGYFRQPTGAGKTVLYSLMAFLLNRKTVIFVPKNNLLEQTKEEMMNLGIPEASIGIVGGGVVDTGRQFMIVNYASHNSKMKKDEKYTQAMNEREVVICDEAHKALGKVTRKKRAAISSNETYGDADAEEASSIELTEEEVSAENEFFQHKEEEFGKRKNVLTLGFTATTELRKKSVHDHFYELIAEEKYAELVAAGILVPFKVVKAATAKVYEDELDYIDANDESNILEREDLYDKLHTALLELKKTSDVPIYPVAFCASHKECDRYQANAEKKGLRSKIVTSREHKSALKEAERELLAGLIDEIVTVDKLTEGWNLPPVNCAIIARASQSPARIVQGVGRTSRSFSGDHYRDYPLHASLRKKHSFIIETDWIRMMRDSEAKEEEKEPEPGKEENAPRVPGTVSAGIKPLDFAQALAMSGEDPTGIVSRYDNSEIAYTIQVDTDELYQGRKICTAQEYLTAHPTISHSSFFRVLLAQKINSIPHLRKKTFYVYFEDAIEAVAGLMQPNKKLAENSDPESNIAQASHSHANPLPKETIYKSDEMGNITIEVNGTLRQAVVGTNIGKALGYAECEASIKGNAIMRKYNVESIPYSTQQAQGIRVNAYWEEDATRVIALEKVEREKMGPKETRTVDRQGKVILDSDGTKKTFWTADGFENIYNLPEGFIESVTKRMSIEPYKVNLSGKMRRLFEESFLQQLRTLTAPDNGCIEMPDIRITQETRTRTCISMGEFARRKSAPIAVISTSLQGKNISPLMKANVISPDALVEIADPQSKFVVKLHKVSDPLRGSYFIAADEKRADMPIVTYKKGNVQGDRLFWLDELENAVKDLNYSS